MRTDPITTPFTIHIDDREKAPYRFTGITGDAKDNHRRLIVPTEFCRLETGDYTLHGFEDVVAVERKSLADIYSTLGQHRDRFEEEHARMAEMKRAIVIIEATWFDIVKWPPEYSRLKPKTVLRTSISWFLRYGVPWMVAEDRRFAEVYTFRFLEKCFREFPEFRIKDSADAETEVENNA